MSAEPTFVLRPEPLMSVTQVPPEYVPMEWPRVAPYLKPAIDRSHGRWTLAAVLHALCLGEQQLWIAYSKDRLYGAMTTQVMSYPGRTMVSVHFLGGEEFDLWGDAMLDRLEGYANQFKCNGIEALGRHGFWKFFQRRGYDRAQMVFERMFGDEA